MKKRFYLGLDLGQVKDPTALTLTERIQQEPEPTWDNPRPKPLPARYEVQKLKRLLRVPYHAIVSHVRDVMEQPELKGKTELVVDGTGVGRSVVDDLRKAGLSPVAITITSGNTISRDAGYTRVPKIELVTVLQMLLQSKRLIINKEQPDAAILEAELHNFKANITKAANLTFGAGSAPDWREGAHDDLVLSLGVAMWCAERRGGDSGSFSYSLGRQKPRDPRMERLRALNRL